MPNFHEIIENGISEVRFANYRRYDDTSDLEPLGRYLWNTALSESLYPSLNFVEIALRNSIHMASTAHFGTDEWMRVVPGALTLGQWQRDKVTELVNDLRHQGKPTHSNSLITGLNFGWWVSLMSHPYEVSIWRPLIRQVFPNLSRHQRTRTQVSNRFTMIRDLRNRVFHHEPIWHRTNLDAQHADIVEACGWLSIELSNTLLKFDRFSSVFASGDEPFKNLL